MKPFLWGPAMWKMLFSTAFNVQKSTVDVFCDLVQTIMPVVLPCKACRDNYVPHIPKGNRRAHGFPKDATHAVRWCYYLKEEVNRQLRRASALTSSEEVFTRLKMHKNHVDEVELADVLVLVALSCQKRGEDGVFCRFCAALVELLPLPNDSALRYYLTQMQSPIVAATVTCAQQTRVQHCRSSMSATHYRGLVNL